MGTPRKARAVECPQGHSQRGKSPDVNLTRGCRVPALDNLERLSPLSQEGPGHPVRGFHLGCAWYAFKMKESPDGYKKGGVVSQTHCKGTMPRMTLGLMTLHGRWCEL